MLTLQFNQETRHQKRTSESTIIDTAFTDYTIADQDEIRKKLHHLLSKNTLLTIKVPGKFATSTLLTTLVHIEKKQISLDGFQNELFNKELLKQNTLAVSANLEGVAVSFILSELNGQDSDGSFTLTAALPHRMEWMQRRNSRRVKVPINIPVKIQYKNQAEYFNVADISVSGLSYIDQTEDHYFSAIGEQHTDCNIVLPDKSVHLASFEIVNNITIPYKHTKQINRIGCEIKRVSYRLDTALQRLINQIDFYYQ